MTFPTVIAHADWGSKRRKRRMATADLTAREAGGSPSYRVISLAPPETGDGRDGALFTDIRDDAGRGKAMIGFDYPIGLPKAYATAADIASFPEFLDVLGSPPWDSFSDVARVAGEITLHRPFYPAVPGGTKREHLCLALGLTAEQLRRSCEGTDAAVLFWTLGAKQVGKGALAGWALLAAARRHGPPIALWPFDGSLPELLDGNTRVVVVETYPREYYRYVRPPGRRKPHWSKTRLPDRLVWIPGLLGWAESLGVTWDADVLRRVERGFSNDDEFDAVIGLLALIAVVTGTIPTGEPPVDSAVMATEGWIIGRQPAVGNT